MFCNFHQIHVYEKVVTVLVGEFLPYFHNCVSLIASNGSFIEPISKNIRGLYRACLFTDNLIVTEVDIMCFCS